MYQGSAPDPLNVGGCMEPRRDTANFTEWDPRTYNSYADFAANVCLDLGTFWEKRDEAAMKEAKAS